MDEIISITDSKSVMDTVGLDSIGASTIETTNPITGNRQMNINLANNMQQSIDKKSALFRRNSSSGRQQSEDPTNQITVVWRNLMYTVERKQMSPVNCFGGDGGHSIRRTQKRTILKGISGRFRTGHLTAVMGPSGSGKSTMLECIVGFRKKGLSGNVTVVSDNQDNVKVALISQTDYLIEVFTVREMLVYASRLKNYAHDIPEEGGGADEHLEEVVSTVSASVDNNLNQVDSSSKHNLIDQRKIKNYHQRMALNVIHKLGLDVCADTNAASCSGGQKKRISIGLEMISKPNILILDEPTSGLDSSACFQTVSVMQRLTKDKHYPTAVVATIHQPSSRVFNLFDHIYIVSYNGYCIYEGSPKDMLQYLSTVDLVCPQFHNPADFIAEVASGEHGSEPVQQLIELKERDDMRLPDAIGSERTLAQYSNENSYPTFLHIWILIQRTSKQMMRDPMLNWLRLLSHVTTSFFIGLLYGDGVGKPALCPPLESPLNDLDNFAEYRMQYQNDLVTTTENLAFVFFTLMFILFGSMMPIIMTFPANLNVLKKEKINGWYSVASYYVALSIAEIPFQIMFPATFVIIGYYMTGQIMSLERFTWFLIVCILMAFVSQSQGLLIGAMFMSDASAAVFLGPITTVPVMLFGGFFVRLSTVPYYLKIFGYLSFLRYCFELIIMTLYGFGRCKLDPEKLNMNVTEKPEWMGMATMVLGEGGEAFIDNFARSLGGTYDPKSGKKYNSAVLEQFNVDEDNFYYNISILVLFFVVLRLMTYYIVTRKINKRD